MSLACDGALHPPHFLHSLVVYQLLHIGVITWEMEGETKGESNI